MELENYLKLAKEIANEASVMALKYFGFETEKTWKGDNTPLTQADTEINSLVIKMIEEKYPEHSVHGEEESSKKEGSKYIWVCDPIDGTMPFSLGIPNFTFSLALVDQTDGQPILGLVNDPILKNMYWATKGSGAFRNGKKISVISGFDTKNTYISIEGSGGKFGISREEIVIKLREKGIKTFQFNSFIYGGIQVANGKFISSIFFGKQAHDVATLKIITEEAGGKVTDIFGKDRRYDEEGDGIVLSNGVLHDEILSCIKMEK